MDLLLLRVLCVEASFLIWFKISTPLSLLQKSDAIAIIFHLPSLPDFCVSE